MSTTIFYITRQGLRVAESLKALYPDASILKFRSQSIPQAWNDSKALIFVMAAGIVVRSIAPLIKDKKTDPAVVVLDEKARYAISLLGGHLGGANELARRIAEFLNAEAVITTATDINGLTPVDLWARQRGLVIENEERLAGVVKKLVENGRLSVYTESETALPPDFVRVSEPQSADVVITNRLLRLKSDSPEDASNVQGSSTGQKLILRPKNLVIGIGCNRGTSSHEIEEAVRKVLDENGLSFLSIHTVATIDKKADEPGLLEFVNRHGFKFVSFNKEQINSVISLYHHLHPKKLKDFLGTPILFSPSEKTFKATGAWAVAEPAAILGSGNIPLTDERSLRGRVLLVPKQKLGNVTVAVAEKALRCQVNAGSGERHKIYIIGTGPGGIEHITERARQAIRDSDVIVGYSTYIELIRDLIKDKEIISTGMTEEIARAKKAVELGVSGKTVSVVSGGDPGIYGMAGLVLEMLKMEHEKSNTSTPKNQKIFGGPRFVVPEVEVIPGVSALNACASRLGAPLMHDFVCISLSDRLTDWSLIEKRLELAAQGDFITVLYNPRSRGRPAHINRARDIFLKYRSPETPVGIVRGAMRSSEKVMITNLRDMPDHEIDMETTVIIGNSHTYVWNNWIITPRGYERKFKG